jgi:hypothetical protein
MAAAALAVVTGGDDRRQPTPPLPSHPLLSPLPDLSEGRRRNRGRRPRAADVHALTTRDSSGGGLRRRPAAPRAAPTLPSPSLPYPRRSARGRRSPPVQQRATTAGGWMCTRRGEHAGGDGADDYDRDRGNTDDDDDAAGRARPPWPHAMAHNSGSLGIRAAAQKRARGGGATALPLCFLVCFCAFLFVRTFVRLICVLLICSVDDANIVLD